MDIELVVRAQEGDHDAFARLAVGLTPRFVGVAFGILRDRLVAEDAAQAALVQVWRELPRLREAPRFQAWAMRILVNTCYREARRTRHWNPALAVVDHDPPAPDRFGSVLDRDQLERGLRRLSAEHRASLVLHYSLDLTQREIADVLGVPAGTVASRLNRAMASLRSALEADARSTAQPAASGEPVR